MFRGKKITILLGLLLIIGMVAVAAPVAAQGIDPTTVELTLYPGDSQDVEKTATTPLYPSVLDLFLLEDETGSFGDDIDTMQGDAGDCSNGLAAEIWDALYPQVDLQGGVSGFRDFNRSYWGNWGDWVYTRYSDLSASESDWHSGVCQLSAGGGNDWPEAQLAALKSAADGVAWDSNGDGDLDDPEDTGLYENPSWRDGATHVIMLVTDAPYHVNGDAPSPPGWPGPTYAETITELDGFHVIILTIDAETGTYASLAEDTDGSVKMISDDSSDIVQATLDALEEVKTDVWWEITAIDPEIEVTFDKEVESGVPGETAVYFTETVSVPKATEPGTYSATVTFYANTWPDEGAPLGEQTITVEVIPVPATIDIKPGSFPNSINLKNKGVIPVGLLGSDTFDVYDVDTSTLVFAFPGGTSPQHWAYEDVNYDGFMDIIAQFNTQASGIVATDTSACLRGRFTDGVTFQGCDTVRIVKPK